MILRIFYFCQVRLGGFIFFGKIVFEPYYNYCISMIKLNQLLLNIIAVLYHCWLFISNTFIFNYVS
jgi:hypothetical protein